MRLSALTQILWYGEESILNSERYDKNLMGVIQDDYFIDEFCQENVEYLRETAVPEPQRSRGRLVISAFPTKRAGAEPLQSQKPATKAFSGVKSA